MRMWNCGTDDWLFSVDARCLGWFAGNLSHTAHRGGDLAEVPFRGAGRATRGLVIETTGRGSGSQRDLLWEVRGQALCLVQIGEDWARLPLFPWRLHFSPWGWPEPLPGVCPCCLHRDRHVVSADSQVMSEAREEESGVQVLPELPVGRPGIDMPISYWGLGPGQARDTKPGSLCPLPFQPPSPGPLPWKAADLPPGEELGQLVDSVGLRAPQEQAQRFWAAQEAEARPGTGRWGTPDLYLVAACAEGRIQISAAPGRRAGWGLVTSMAFNPGCCLLFRMKLSSSSCFYGETNSTWCLLRQVWGLNLFRTMLPRGRQAECRIRMTRAVTFNLGAALKLYGCIRSFPCD